MQGDNLSDYKVVTEV